METNPKQAEPLHRQQIYGLELSNLEVCSEYAVALGMFPINRHVTNNVQRIANY
jgi:hypothetical protein